MVKSLLDHGANTDVKAYRGRNPFVAAGGDEGVLRILVEHGVDGYLVEPGDVKEAARYAIEILSRADRGRDA